MNIRSYTASDNNALLELLRLNTPEYFAPEEEPDFIEYLAHRIDRYFVAETDGRIIGCGGVNLTDNGKTARISWDIVHPESHGTGVGRALLQFRIEQIRAIPGIERISVRTSQLAYRFYERFGFEVRETVADYWAEGFDLYHMERSVEK